MVSSHGAFACVCPESTLCKGSDCQQVSTATGLNLSQYDADHRNTGPNSLRALPNVTCQSYDALNPAERYVADYHTAAGASGHKAEGSRHDQDTVNVVFVATGDDKHLKQAMVAMTSILMTRTSLALSFFVFTDDKHLHSGLLVDYRHKVENDCTKLHLHDFAPVAASMRALATATHFNSTHYSGIYSMSKVLIHDFLPARVNHYMLLDTDMVLIGSIGSLRQAARHMLKRRPGSAVVMSCSYDPRRIQSYCTRTSTPQNCHPTHYCVSAPYYVDMTKVRQLGWTKVAVRAAMQAMHDDYPTKAYYVADQDVWNRIFADTPDWMAPLPCRWRGDFSSYNSANTEGLLPHLDKCYNERLQVVHYNAGSNTPERHGLWDAYSKLDPRLTNDPSMCPIRALVDPPPPPWRSAAKAQHHHGAALWWRCAFAALLLFSAALWWRCSKQTQSLHGAALPQRCSNLALRHQ